MMVEHPVPEGAAVTAIYYERAAIEREIAKHRRRLEAAPALLDACKAHDRYMLAMGYADPEDPALHPNAAENWRRARAAIAKAEGKV